MQLIHKSHQIHLITLRTALEVTDKIGSSTNIVDKCIGRVHIFLPPYPFPYLALLALRLGEVEEAIDLMEIEIDKGSFTQFWIRPMFQNEKAVRNHPRYLKLLKRIGLDDESVAELHRKLSFD